MNEETPGTKMARITRMRAPNLTTHEREYYRQKAREYFEVDKHPPKQVGPYIISTRPRPHPDCSTSTETKVCGRNRVTYCPLCETDDCSTAAHSESKGAVV